MRLKRMGTRQKPFYRIVVADSRSPRDGRFIEQIGTYDPKLDPPAVTVDREKAELWLSRGAQPSDTVRALLVKQGILPPLPPRELGGGQKAAAAAPAAPAGEEAPAEQE